WESLLKIAPTDIVYASYNRARIYIYQGDYFNAEAEIAKGLAFEPHHPMLLTYGAVTDYYRGKVARATDTLEAVLVHHPSLHSLKIFLAYCYFASGERERALELIDDNVIESARADQDIAYRLAVVYALDAQEDKALEWLERAISIGNE